MTEFSQYAEADYSVDRAGQTNPHIRLGISYEVIEQNLLVASGAVVALGNTVNRYLKRLVGDQRVTEATYRVVSGCIDGISTHGQ
ncbi:hypothetical protein D3C77_580720 [compost metagenome]